MFKSFSKDQRGLAHVGLIALAILVIAAGAFVAWRVLSEDGVSLGDTTEKTQGNATFQIPEDFVGPIPDRASDGVVYYSTDDTIEDNDVVIAVAYYEANRRLIEATMLEGSTFEDLMKSPNYDAMTRGVYAFVGASDRDSINYTLETYNDEEISINASADGVSPNPAAFVQSGLEDNPLVNLRANTSQYLYTEGGLLEETTRGGYIVVVYTEDSISDEADAQAIVDSFSLM